MKKKRLRRSIISKPQVNLPTDADFERASRQMAEVLRLDDAIRSRVLSKFGGVGELHDFHVFPGNEDWDVYLFMPLDRALGSPLAHRLRQQVTDTILDVLEAEGSGPCATLVLRVEMDSHESVQRNCNGNYHKRFR